MERKVFLTKVLGGGVCAVFERTGSRVKLGHPFYDKPASKKYSEVDARARFDRAPNDTPSAPLKLILTATMKRRHQEKPEKSRQKRPGGVARPAMTSFLLHDQNDRDQS